MATTQRNILTLASISVLAGGTKLAPRDEGKGTSCDLGAHDGAMAQIRFTNGATGPTLAAAATIYGSHDGQDWTEINTVYGDLVSGGAPSGQYVFVDRMIRYVKGEAWGNTGQAVTVQIRLLYLEVT